MNSEDSAAKMSWVQRRWGSWLLGLGGFMGYVAAGQVLPGVVIVIWLMMKSGGVSPPADLDRQIIPYIPHLGIWSMLMCLLLVGLLKAAGWLAPGPSAHGRWWGRLLWIVGSSLACLLGLIAISTIQVLLGFPVKEQELILNALADGGVMFYLTVVLLVPIGEEFLFRRFLYSTLARANPRLVACVVSALLFSLIHLNFTGTLLYIWMAFCFTAAYERSGSVWGAVAVHAINNFIALWGASAAQP